MERCSVSLPIPTPFIVLGDFVADTSGYIPFHSSAVPNDFKQLFLEAPLRNPCAIRGLKSAGVILSKSKATCSHHEITKGSWSQTEGSNRYTGGVKKDTSPVIKGGRRNKGPAFRSGTRIERATQGLEILIASPLMFRRIFQKKLDRHEDS